MPYLRSAVLAVIALSAAGCDPAVRPDGREVDPPPPKRPEGYHVAKPTPIDADLQAAAVRRVQLSLRSPDELVRGHAVEAIGDDALPGLAGRVLPMLDDPSLYVRKAAALTAGRLRLADARPGLVRLLNVPSPIGFVPGDPDRPISAERARLAAIFGLHMLGDTRFSNQLVQAAAAPGPQIRGDTALILGLIGNTSGRPGPVPDEKRDPLPNVRLQAAASLWQLGDERGEDVLVQATVSNYALGQNGRPVGACRPPRPRRAAEHLRPDHRRLPRSRPWSPPEPPGNWATTPASAWPKPGPPAATRPAGSSPP